MRKKLVPNRVTNEGSKHLVVDGSETPATRIVAAIDQDDDVDNEHLSSWNEVGRDGSAALDKFSSARFGANGDADSSDTEVRNEDRLHRYMRNWEEDAEPCDLSGENCESDEFDYMNLPDNTVFVSPRAPQVMDGKRSGSLKRKRSMVRSVAASVKRQNVGICEAHKASAIKRKKPDPRLCYETIKCGICADRVELGGSNLQDAAKLLSLHPVLKFICCKKCTRMFETEMATDRFVPGTDGSHAACSWCACGGQLVLCDKCPRVFCRKCVRMQLGRAYFSRFEQLDDDASWHCLVCDPPLELKALQATAREFFEAARLEAEFEAENDASTWTKENERRKSHSNKIQPNVSSSPAAANGSGKAGTVRPTSDRGGNFGKEISGVAAQNGHESRKKIRKHTAKTGRSVQTQTSNASIMFSDPKGSRHLAHTVAVPATEANSSNLAKTSNESIATALNLRPMLSDLRQDFAVNGLQAQQMLSGDNSDNHSMSEAIAKNLASKSVSQSSNLILIAGHVSFACLNRLEVSHGRIRQLHLEITNPSLSNSTRSASSQALFKELSKLVVTLGDVCTLADSGRLLMETEKAEGGALQPVGQTSLAEPTTEELAGNNSSENMDSAVEAYQSSQQQSPQRSIDNYECLEDSDDDSVIITSPARFAGPVKTAVCNAASGSKSLEATTSASKLSKEAGGLDRSCEESDEDFFSVSSSRVESEVEEAEAAKTKSNRRQAESSKRKEKKTSTKPSKALKEKARSSSQPVAKSSAAAGQSAQRSSVVDIAKRSANADTAVRRSAWFEFESEATSEPEPSPLQTNSSSKSRSEALPITQADGNTVEAPEEPPASEPAPTPVSHYDSKKSRWCHFLPPRRVEKSFYTRPATLVRSCGIVLQDFRKACPSIRFKNSETVKLSEWDRIKYSDI